MKLPTLLDFKGFIEDEQGIILSSSIKSQFRYIKSYFSDKDFNRENVRAMMQELRLHGKNGTPLKKTTIKKYLQTTKLIANCLGLGFLNNYKGASIHGRENEQVDPLGDLITDSEMRAIAECDLDRQFLSVVDNKLVNQRYRAIFTCLRFSGMPPDDLCNLTWSKDKSTHFELNRGKTGKLMLVPIPEELRTLLDELPRYPHNYIFGTHYGRPKAATIRDEIKKRCEALNIKKHVTCYSFRYSMITWCYINAGEGMLPKISRITGHTINTALQHYAKFDVKTLTDVLYATHPGLRGSQDIDNIKRIIINLISGIIDVSRYEVRLEIVPKEGDKRVIHIS